MIPLYDDNPSHRRPFVTVGLIAACSLVFLWQASLDPRAQQAAAYGFGFVPAVVLGERILPVGLAVVPAWATLVTSMFLHGGFLHLAGNMLYLWVFGNNVEDAMGHGRFALFYLLSGLAAAAAQAAPDPGSVVPMIGASGAISGVLGAYLVLFPHARVQVLIPFGFMWLHHIKAGWLLGFWFLLQLLSGIGADEQSGVAWWAHVGGFVAGVVLVLPFRDRQFLTRRRAQARRARGRSRIPRSAPRRSGPWS